MFRYVSATLSTLILSGCSLDLSVFTKKNVIDLPSSPAAGLVTGYYFTSTDFATSTTLHFENGDGIVRDIVSVNLLSNEIYSVNKKIVFIAYEPITYAASLAQYDGTNVTYHFNYGGYNNSRVVNGILYFIGKLDAADPDLTLFAWDGVSATPTAIHSPMDQQAPIFALNNGDIAFIPTNSWTDPTYFGRPGSFTSVAMTAGYSFGPTVPVALGNSLVSIAREGLVSDHLVKIEPGAPMSTIHTFSADDFKSSLYSSGGRVYFTVEDSVTSQIRLYKFDGTTLTDLNETSASTKLLTAAQNGAYVILDRGSGSDLYFYNGTAFTKITNYNGVGFPASLTCGSCSTQDYTIMKDGANNYYFATPTSFQILTMDTCLSGGLSSFYQLGSRVYLTSSNCTAQMTGPTTFTQIRSSMGSRVPAYIAP